MKKFILSIAIFLLFSIKSFGHVEHYANYNYLEYELFRNNTSIGYHKYNFLREKNNLTVDSTVVRTTGTQSIAGDKTFTGTTTGSGLLGTINLEDGDYTFAVQSENDKLKITLVNDSHFPSNFINASWQGYYVTASSRA